MGEDEENMKPRVKEDGKLETPAEVESRLSRSINNLRNVVMGVLAVLLLANLAVLGAVVARGTDNHNILTTIKQENGPEAAAVNKAYLDYIRAQIDCDGQKREEVGDNAILASVAEVVPFLRGRTVDLVSKADSCKSIPDLEKKLAVAAAELQRVRDGGKSRAGP